MAHMTHPVERLVANLSLKKGNYQTDEAGHTQ
jgi:hypothetical protein